MRDSTKRVTVAIAGVALAVGALLAAAPAADAATTESRAATVGSATAAGWDDDYDDCPEYRAHRDHRRDRADGRGQWKRHRYDQRYRDRHHRRHHRWHEHGRYDSYAEAYLIGRQFVGSSWQSFECYEVSGYFVLRVLG